MLIFINTDTKEIHFSRLLISPSLSCIKHRMMKQNDTIGIPIESKCLIFFHYFIVILSLTELTLWDHIPFRDTISPQVDFTEKVRGLIHSREIWFRLLLRTCVISV